MNNINSDAFKLSKEIINLALQTLLEMKSKNQINRKKINKIEITMPGGARLSSEYKLDWFISSSLALAKIEQFPIYSQFEQAALEDSQLGSRLNRVIGSSIQKRLMRCSDFLQTLLSASIEYSCGDLLVSDEDFINIWDSAVKLLLQNRIRIKYWSILENVEIPLGLTEILPNVFLRGLEVREMEDLWNNHGIIQSYYPFANHIGTSIFNVQTLLEMTIEETVVVSDNFESSNDFSHINSVQNSFDSICTSIRLLRPERIILSPLIINANDFWSGTTAVGNRELSSIPFGGRCKLSEEDMNELQKLLKVVNKGESGLSRSINVCLRRISYANKRISSEDKLLDTIMALEALILSDSGDPKERGELSFRLSMRLAKFLGDDQAKQINIFEMVRKAYKLRSKVVHGDQLDSDDATLIDNIGKLTRDAIRKYLHVQADGKKIDWKALLFD